MTRAATLLLTLGAALFVGLLAWQGFGPVVSTLLAAGWGIVVVAGFHLLPLALDAVAISVLFRPGRDHMPLRDALFARWAGESVSCLLPAGQIGGPIAMVRHLSQRGVPMTDAAAGIIVSITLQAFGQIIFAVAGLALFAAYAVHGAPRDLLAAVLAATAVLGGLIVLFFVAQRRGLFGRLLRIASKASSKRDWTALTGRADAIDLAVQARYRQRGRAAASFALSLAGWLSGIAEVWLALRFLGHPVGWVAALLLESIGQAIRGAAFAIPGSLGVQEGGYLLLGPLVGLPAEAALALSLAKRARELLLGLPGLVYLHFSERNWQRQNAKRVPAID